MDNICRMINLNLQFYSDHSRLAMLLLSQTFLHGLYCSKLNVHNFVEEDSDTLVFLSYFEF